MRKFVTLLAVLFVGLGASAQNRPVTGTVTDSDGHPVVGAVVSQRGTSNVAITTADGRYSINAPADATLVFSVLGMATQEVAVESRSVVDVVMLSVAESIDEVIVVAYGTARKESFTGSAVVLKAEDITKRSATNVSKALQGLVPGLTATSGGGQPGDAASFQIRGASSINAGTTPLIVVDGAPYSGALAAINPADIANISILKDASAGALYGSRGANGVVMITTRRGDGSGRVNVNFRASVGVVSRGQKPYDLADAKEFVSATYMGLKNDNMFKNNMDADAAHIAALAGLDALGGEQYNPFKGYTWSTLIDPNTGNVVDGATAKWNEPWGEWMENKAAKRQEYSLNLSGGNASTSSRCREVTPRRTDG